MLLNYWFSTPHFFLLLHEFFNAQHTKKENKKESSHVMFEIKANQLFKWERKKKFFVVFGKSIKKLRNLLKNFKRISLWMNLETEHLRACGELLKFWHFEAFFWILKEKFSELWRSCVMKNWKLSWLILIETFFKVFQFI